MPCNGKLIAQLRKLLGWTQNDLARKSGFTERLIVKAEASQNIATSTLQIIAETFREAGAQVTAADLSADPAALAREFILSMYKHSVIQPPKDHSEIENFQFVSTGHGALVWGDTWAHPIGMPMPGPIKLAIKMDFRDGLMTVFDDRFDTLEGAKHFAEAMQCAERDADVTAAEPTEG